MTVEDAAYVASLMTELRQQSLEAWMRNDYNTADRIAKLIGDPLPSEHEKSSDRPDA